LATGVRALPASASWCGNDVVAAAAISTPEMEYHQHHQHHHQLDPNAQPYVYRGAKGR
jgi:hypothetical protein